MTTKTVSAPPAAGSRLTPAIIKAYADAKREALKKKKIPSDIAVKWSDRNQTHGFDRRGASGADDYLAQFGRNISTEKTINLARLAEESGHPDVANRFWARAFANENDIDVDSLPDVGSDDDDAAETIAKTVVRNVDGKRAHLAIAALPDDMQPGKLSTMQPVDTELSRESLINNPLYIAQPKRNGHRRVTFVGDEGVAYQARSRNRAERQSPEIENAMIAAHKEYGAFVLDGEAVWLDVNGGEHLTQGHVALANVEIGQPGAPARPRYSVFKALYFRGRDLRLVDENARLEAGEEIGALLEGQTDQIEFLRPARTAQEKRALVDKQFAEGREGEVWVRTGCTYHGGKDSYGHILRTKYAQPMNVLIVGLTSTTVKDRPFGALKIAAFNNEGERVDLGNVGTGFDQTQMQEIAAAWTASKGSPVPIAILTRGRTESGKLNHASYEALALNVKPSECVLPE